MILIFGPFDPSGSSSLPADAVTCGALGAHALSTITSIHVQDTTGIEEIQTVGSELIDDQARCLLEDMPVQAIKIGPLYTSESVSVLAQIAADYSKLPLMLHLTPLPDEALLDDNDTEDALHAIFELLLPQTDIVFVDHALANQWQSHGLLPQSDTDKAAASLLEFGATWVLSSGSPVRPGYLSTLLQGPDNQTFSWPAPPRVERLVDADGPLACAITAELARGRNAPEAVEIALNTSARLALSWFQPGMGHRLLNRAAS